MIRWVRVMGRAHLIAAALMGALLACSSFGTATAPSDPSASTDAQAPPSPDGAPAADAAPGFCDGWTLCDRFERPDPEASPWTPESNSINTSAPSSLTTEADADGRVLVAKTPVLAPTQRSERFLYAKVAPKEAVDMRFNVEAAKAQFS